MDFGRRQLPRESNLEVNSPQIISSADSEVITARCGPRSMGPVWIWSQTNSSVYIYHNRVTVYISLDTGYVETPCHCLFTDQRPPLWRLCFLQQFENGQNMASERARIRRELYGPDRAKVVEEMRSKLTKDSVLQPGEYNNVGTGPGTWSSITTRDYGVSTWENVIWNCNPKKFAFSRWEFSRHRSNHRL